MSTLLEELKAVEDNANQTAMSEYRELVRQLAAGNDDPELSNVQAILAVTGKTAADLQNDVHVRQSRDCLHATVAAADAAKTERPAIQKQIDAADAELEAAKQRHKETTRPLYARLQEITQLTIDRAAAIRELRDTCTDPVLLNRQKENQQLAKAVANELRLARRNLTSREQQKIAELEQRQAELLAESNAIIQAMIDW